MNEKPDNERANRGSKRLGESVGKGQVRLARDRETAMKLGGKIRGEASPVLERPRRSGLELVSYLSPATLTVNGTKVAGPINYKPQLDRVLSSADKLYRSLSETRMRGIFP